MGDDRIGDVAAQHLDQSGMKSGDAAGQIPHLHLSQSGGGVSCGFGCASAPNSGMSLHAVVTNDADLARTVRTLSQHGGLRKYEHELIGDGTLAIFKATVSLPTGGKATGYGSETAGDFGDFIGGLLLGGQHVVAEDARQRGSRQRAHLRPRDRRRGARTSAGSLPSCR